MEMVPERSTTTEPAGPHFTGGVWRTTYLSGDGPQGLAGARFLYAPGGRSHWHVHEQAIIGTHGHGLVFWEGLDHARRLGSDDWWHVEPGVRHWHGAAPDSVFSHLAVTAGGATIWLEEVSEEDYLRALPPA